ncbi:LysR family transcriptional regulator [Lacticaseibacillus zhaodongensis]|uniref:LysR family transcriptional regulator n=1 Tax=Lacticaseibacillus zhaodongensis TaxID=2668065 RepID=UPI0012D35CFF|nr:LysR family transcriptional regulator [Lacticaseibacillus zhaodongensis]
MASFSYQVFAAVVNYGTFAQAAGALNVTPSAVSHSISQLETELGFPLFIRSRSGVELTSDGRTVLPVIQGILNLEDQLQQVADNINGLAAGRVRIGAFSSVSTNWLPPIIRAYKKRYPQVQIEVVQAGFNDIAEEVRTGTIDIGFSLLPVNANVTVEPLLKDPIYCVTPSDFVPRAKTYVDDDDIAKRNFILQQQDYDRDTKMALDRYHVSTNSITYSIDDQSILSMVESGLGMGILPQLALNKLVGSVNTYPFSEPFARTLCLLVNPTQAQAPSVARMQREIERYLADQYGADYLGHRPHAQHAN